MSIEVNGWQVLGVGVLVCSLAFALGFLARGEQVRILTERHYDHVFSEHWEFLLDLQKQVEGLTQSGDGITETVPGEGTGRVEVTDAMTARLTGRLSGLQERFLRHLVGDKQYAPPIIAIMLQTIADEQGRTASGTLSESWREFIDDNAGDIEGVRASMQVGNSQPVTDEDVLADIASKVLEAYNLYGKREGV